MSAAKSPKVRPLPRLLNNRQWQRVARCLAMSERELQIAKLIFDDEPERAIATRLGITPHTVHTHMQRLYVKLDVKSRVGLVLRILGEHRADAEQHSRQIPSKKRRRSRLVG